MRRPVSEVRARLLDWYRAHRRALPWRKTRDPYAIWISEVMLQQTRVDTVVPYYETFLRRWPTVNDLASADPDDVRSAWSGLGYYRRARLMLDAARIVAEEHDGRFPADPDALRALPGFGRYTAGAVASIAFDVAAPAVDGNVSRVLARLSGIEGDVTRGEALRKVWALAETLAPGPAPGDYTQAVIELGATICAVQRPRCLLCPVQGACVAQAEGTTDRIPPPRKKANRKTVSLTALMWLDHAEVLLEQQADRGLFASLWTPPLVEGVLSEKDAMRYVERNRGWAPTAAASGGEVKHVLTHRDLLIKVVQLDGRAAPVAPPFRWVRLDALDGLGVPSLTTKLLRKVLRPDELAGASLPGRRTSRRR